MSRKDHLKHTANSGPTCQRGRTGGALRGEHLTAPFAEFKALPPARRCARCAASPLFAYLQRQEAKTATVDWEPEAPDAWKAADDAVMAAHRAKRAAAVLARAGGAA